MSNRSSTGALEENAHEKGARNPSTLKDSGWFRFADRTAVQG